MLCHCVTPANRARYSRQLEEMHRQRHAFFVEKKGWSELRRPAGRLHFAGEHTEALAGYMESAVRSGHRVAAGITR